MEHKYQNTKTIYQKKLSFLLFIQSALWLLTLISLEAVYLFGSNNLLPSDFSYFLIISILLVLLYFNNYTNNRLYWYIRPKLSLVFFQNITNVTVLIFLGIQIYLVYSNLNEKLILPELGIFGAFMLMVSLPICFYLWLSLHKTSKDAINELAKDHFLSSYFSIEPYVTLVVFAIFGIFYDFLPQNFNFLVILPLAVAISCVIIDVIINRQLLKGIESIAKIKHIVPKNAQSHTLFELSPYTFFSSIVTLFNDFSKEEKINALNIIKSFSAIDQINNLTTIAENETDIQLKHKVIETKKHLEGLIVELKSIVNIYEYVEQSNNYSIIKAIIRDQLNECDKNLLIKLLNDNRPSIVKASCLIAGHYNDINFISLLISQLDNPKTSIYAQFSLKSIGEKVIKYLEIEFSKRKNSLFFVEACFEVLIHIKKPEAHNLLFLSLNDPNKTIVRIAAKKIIITYDKVDNDKRKYFTELFNRLIINTISNYYLLKEIEKHNQTFYVLKRAFQDENNENLVLIESLLKLYYEHSIVGNIFSLYDHQEASKHLLAINLIDLLFKGNLEINNKLKALFSPEDNRIKEYILEEYPSFEYDKQYKNEEDLVWHVLNMNYDEINNWTRSTAINTLQYLYAEDIPFELAAEFLNSNSLLKETAALCIYRNIPEFYSIFLDRLDKKEALNIDFIVRSNTDFSEIDSLRSDNMLLYKKIQFLSSIPYLKELAINEINTFHHFFRPKVLEPGSHQVDVNDENISGYWIIESGEIQMSQNGTDYQEYSKRDIIEISPSMAINKHIYFNINKPVRFLIIEKIILLNILKNSYNIIFESMMEITDFSTNLQISNNIPKKVA